MCFKTSLSRRQVQCWPYRYIMPDYQHCSVSNLSTALHCCCGYQTFLVHVSTLQHPKMQFSSRLRNVHELSGLGFGLDILISDWKLSERYIVIVQRARQSSVYIGWSDITVIYSHNTISILQGMITGEGWLVDWEINVPLQHKNRLYQG